MRKKQQCQVLTRRGSLPTNRPTYVTGVLSFDIIRSHVSPPRSTTSASTLSSCPRVNSCLADYGQLPVTGIAAPMDPEMGMMLKPDAQAGPPVEQMELEGGAQKPGFSNTLDESVSDTLVRPNQSDAIN